MRITPEPEFSDYHLPFEASVTKFSQEDISRSIIDRFLPFVCSQPEAIAVESDSGILSYRELNDIADRISSHILAKSTDTRIPISLIFEDAKYLIAAIFGVLKSGHPYLVLDPEYPSSRLALMLKDSCAQQIIAQAGGVELAEQLGRDDINIDVFDEVVSSSTSNTTPAVIGSDSLALVMYTSGSTGTPQGVVHTHRSLLAEVYNITNSWRVGSKDKFLLLSSCAFASSIRTIFGALLNGGTVVPYNIDRNGFNKLGETIERRGVTILRSLPTTFRHYLKSIGDLRKFQNVRMVSLGGETVTPTDVRLFNRHFAEHAILVLSFGPTECLTACWGFAKHGEDPLEHRVPMGFERRFKQIVLVDETGKEVKTGESGELTVTSKFLSEGYWNNAAATGARFVTNKDGATTFFTGDIATRNEDGSYTHLGRKDFQIKVRGYRVDVFEIENVLREISGIRDSAVVGQNDENGETRIVAFLMIEPGFERPDTSQLQNFVGKRLPKYMIPAVFVALQNFPLNSNGKLDRRALPKIENDVVQENKIEQASPSFSIDVLRSLWSKALKTDDVPVDKDFLSLGGDSLQAMEVAYKIKEQFGIDMSPAFILDQINLSTLAEHIEREFSERFDNRSN